MCYLQIINSQKCPTLSLKWSFEPCLLLRWFVNIKPLKKVTNNASPSNPQFLPFFFLIWWNEIILLHKLLEDTMYMFAFGLNLKYSDFV